MTLEPADRLNELLDGDLTAQEPTFPEGTPDVPPSELAEQLFVAGALRHLLAEDEGHLDRQVGRAFATIAISERRSHLRRSLTWAATAAAVVLIAFVVAMRQPEDLMATVRRVIDAAQQNIDREFVVRTLWHEDALLADQPQSRLTVRGSPKFAVMIPSPIGDLWFGTDGEEFWSVMGQMPPRIFGNPERMRRFEDQWGIMTEAFRLPNLLKRLRTDYDVALTQDSTEPEQLIDFTAHWRDTIDDRAPEYIRIVADRQTGKLHKLVITFGPNRPPMAPWVMFVKLVSEDPKPDNFYSANYPR